MGKRLIATIIVLIIILVAFLVLIPNVFKPIDKDGKLQKDYSVVSEVPIEWR